eukprot:CAMPEP_0196714308 /NCGR_PEP_ID=MMETSP1090-20130531/75649_1 /TAXON_ID=37098 /ORGANISM="Isochrysis sp, Strain CCMP1244" /LENGTH=145 /DNA_ID=CAMNT_0042054413 /DNA_START=134 /DNA_END=570 /DNA_ORIENTATION=+
MAIVKAAAAAHTAAAAARELAVEEEAPRARCDEIGGLELSHRHRVAAQLDGERRQQVARRPAEACAQARQHRRAKHLAPPGGRQRRAAAHSGRRRSGGKSGGDGDRAESKGASPRAERLELRRLGRQMPLCQRDHHVPRRFLEGS